MSGPYAVARRQLADGLAYTSERNLDFFRLYILAFRARLELDHGLWTEAADDATVISRGDRRAALA